jgi:hypothetical protein
MWNVQTCSEITYASDTYPNEAARGAPRFDSAEASRYLHEEWGIKIAGQTLARLASKGGGPNFRKFGRRRLYDRPHLDEWALSRLSVPRTSTRAVG